ncbi:NUMOD4 domain-containing protein [Lacticaseibacillus suibinensis]|uniref:NUMOD4 domain-containing protein n=1 Tax=Lacticaseibacillus suibinensis TaxID=2486011 RepID=UPI001EF260DC|nr:NUMOD4 domain-containing protein [Lacticaseibacillus suibinensis]
MQELWKKIPASTYAVSSRGRLRSGGRFIRPFVCPNGYLRISLVIAGVRKNYYVHRLVAQAFLLNPDDLPCVNHKDESRDNNDAANLEWCDYLYNNTYNGNAKRRGEQRKNPIIAFSVTGAAHEYPSAVDAANDIGISKGHISECLHGKRRSAGGYTYAYATD